MSEIIPAPQRALVPDTGRMQVADVLAHVVAVQEVMKSVMKPDVHYGVIPGTPKPSLYKQGAEVLCLTFRIAPKYTTESLCETGLVKYRVTCTGIHQATGVMLGEGIGECSSDEEKYRWRKMVAQQEWDDTPQHMRRVKLKRGKNNTTYTESQVRTEPADLANTVLKMAGKRAMIAMVLAVTGASSMFSQDLEDLEENLRRHLADEGGTPPPPPPPPPEPTAEQLAAKAQQEEESFKKWLAGPAQKAIDKGAKHDDVLTFAKGRGKTLTDAHIAAIMALKKAEQSAGVGAEEKAAAGGAQPAGADDPPWVDEPAGAGGGK